MDNGGQFTRRVEYNPVFSKTTQGGSKVLASSKWLIRNNENENLCPVRLFLTVNPAWEKGCWYKNSPTGLNTLPKWTKQSAQKIGLDIKKWKMNN